MARAGRLAWRMAPWLASAAAHGALFVFALRPAPDRAETGGELAPELPIVDIEIDAPEPPSAAPDRGDDREGAPGGSPAPARAPVRHPEPSRAPIRSDVVAAASPRSGTADPIAPAAPAVAPVPLSIRGGGLLGANGRGSGTGLGSGTGPGRGSGRAGHGSDGLPERAARRADRPRSRARPPRLIYPRRDRKEEPGKVFVVRLTIDENGYVAGVKLIQRVDPFADEKAMNAVWRFRYAPALDDSGRPIQVRIDQRFMLE